MIYIKATASSPENIQINIPYTTTTHPIDSEILFHQEYILYQYKQLATDVTAIIFNCECPDMSTDLLEFALQNLPLQINNIGLDIKNLWIGFILENLPKTLITLDLSNCNLGDQSLVDLYFMFNSYMNNKNRNIEIIANPKLYAALQSLLNFEQLLEQVTTYIKQYPDNMPSASKPIIPNSAIENDMAIQFMQIIKLRCFKKSFTAIFTLALLHSGGIANGYTNAEFSNHDKITRDQAKADAYKSLWHYAHQRTTPAIHQQAILLITELGLEYDISTQRQDLVKKYCSSQQNALEETIGHIIANPPFISISSNRIINTFKQLFFQLRNLPVNQLHNYGKLLQILDQMHYWLKMFYQHRRDEKSIKEVIQLFENNKDILHILDHETFVANCTKAHNFCLANNKNILSYNIPSKPSEELLLCAYMEGLCALANCTVEQFIQNPTGNFNIYVNNIHADILLGYSVWDTNINKSIIHLDLVYALFYAGIIINTNSHDQIDMHKTLEHLNIYATKNNFYAKKALHAIRYIINHDYVTDVLVVEAIRIFLVTYGYLDNMVAEDILRLIDRPNPSDRNSNSVIFSNLRQSEFDEEEQVMINNKNNRKDRYRIKRNGCCNMM